MYNTIHSKLEASKQLKSYPYQVISLNQREPLLLEQIFQALQHDRTFVFTDVPVQQCNAIKILLNSLSSFMTEDQAIKDKFERDESIFPGFHPDGKFLRFGVDGDRYIFEMDVSRKFAQPFPQSCDEKISLEEANTIFADHCYFLTTLIMRSLAKGLELEEEQMLKYITHHALVSYNSYKPITKERIKFWFDQRKLVLADDMLERCPSHKDSMLGTMIHYPGGDASGLEFKHKTGDKATSKFLPVMNIPEDNMVFFPGKMLEFISANKVKAVRHRVVVEPSSEGFYRNSTRTALIAFQYSAGEILKPALSSTSSEDSSISQAAFFDKIINKINAKIDTRVAKEFPEELAEAFENSAKLS